MARLFERQSNFISISEFYENYSLNKYRFDVDYQRLSDVWSEDKKSFLIDSILKNYPIPAIFLRPSVNNESGKTVYDVVDGKQRLETIIAFIEDRIPLTTYFAEDDFIDEENLSVANQIAGLTFSEIKKNSVLFQDYLKQFWTYSISVEYLYEKREDVVASVFDRLNRNGEPLTSQELRNAKYVKTPILLAIKALANNEFWKNKLKSGRMEDHEFVSELLFLILEGKIIGSESIDKLYEKYKSDKDGIKTAKKVFTKIIKYLEDLNLDYAKYKKLCWTTHLYTIFAVAWKVYDTIEAKTLHDKITEFYTIYFAKEKIYEGSFRDYKDASSSRTRSETQRKKRFKALMKYIETGM